jgi:hypothetical protein
MITVGAGNTSEKSAIAVVEGSHLLGVELAMGYAEQFLAQALTAILKI